MDDRKNKELMFINTVRDVMKSNPSMTVDQYAEKFGIFSKKEIRTLLKMATKNKPEEFHQLLGRTGKNSKKVNEGKNNAHKMSKKEYQKFIDNVNNIATGATESVTAAEELLKGYRED